MPPVTTAHPPQRTIDGVGSHGSGAGNLWFDDVAVGSPPLSR